MMMLPRKRSDFDLWDQMFSDPFFTGERESKLMKTDIKEKKDKYIVDIDLPGYEKENIYGEQLPFAYSLTDASLYSVRLEGTYCYSILGRSRTGKTNTMKLLLHAAAAQPAKTNARKPVFNCTVTAPHS